MKERFDLEATVQIFPPNSLGNDINVLESVQNGFVDISSNTTAQFSVFDDSFAFVDLPYAIPDWETALRCSSPTCGASRPKNSRPRFRR